MLCTIYMIAYNEWFFRILWASVNANLQNRHFCQLLVFLSMYPHMHTCTLYSYKLSNSVTMIYYITDKCMFLTGRKVVMPPEVRWYSLPYTTRPTCRTHTHCTVLYVQEVVTIHKKCLLYLHQKMRCTPFLTIYDTFGWILFVYRAK